MKTIDRQLFDAMKSSDPFEQVMALERIERNYRPVPTNPATRETIERVSVATGNGACQIVEFSGE